MADHDSHKHETEPPKAEDPPARLPYQPPRLTRWGTLKELTRGGGGTKSEPSKRRTRF